MEMYFYSSLILGLSFVSVTSSDDWLWSSTVMFDKVFDLIQYDNIKGGAALILVVIMESVGGATVAWKNLAWLVLADSVVRFMHARHEGRALECSYDIIAMTIKKAVLYMFAIASLKSVDDTFLSIDLKILGLFDVPPMYAMLIAWFAVLEFCSIKTHLEDMGIYIIPDWVTDLMNKIISAISSVGKK